MRLPFVSRALLLSTLVMIAAAAWNLGGPPVTDIMEVRNLITAREMAEGGPWLIPTMNGELRLAKPPLPTWAAAAAWRLAGDANLLALRLPTLAFALLGIVSLVCYARRMGLSDDTAIWSGIVLATMFLYARNARFAMWDMPLHACAMATIWCAAEASARRSLSWAAAAGLFAAASFMSKWPATLVVMVLPWIATQLLFHRDDLPWRWRESSLALSLALMLSAAWPVYVWTQVPTQIQQMFLQEGEAVLSRHVRSVVYYAHWPVLTGAWVLPAAAAGAAPLLFKEYFARKSVRSAWWWMVLSLVLISLVPSKKDRYALPLLFPAAILIAQWFEYAAGASARAVRRTLRLQQAVLAAGAVASVPIVAGLTWTGRVARTDALLMTGFALAGSLLAITIVRRRRPLEQRVRLATAVMAAAGLSAGWQVQYLGEPDRIPVQPVAAAVAATVPIGVPLVASEPVDLSLIWAAGRPIGVMPATRTQLEHSWSALREIGWIGTVDPRDDPRLRALQEEGVVLQVLARTTYRWRDGQPPLIVARLSRSVPVP